MKKILETRSDPNLGRRILKISNTPPNTNPTRRADHHIHPSSAHKNIFMWHGNVDLVSTTTKTRNFDVMR